MLKTVERLYKNGKVDLGGLNRAVTLGWITEEEKQTIVETE